MRHHPPVSAFHAGFRSRHAVDGAVFHGSLYPKLKFWGKTIDITPKGTMTLELPR